MKKYQKNYNFTKINKIIKHKKNKIKIKNKNIKIKNINNNLLNPIKNTINRINIPDKNLTIKELANLLSISDIKIKETIKLLNFKEKSIIKPHKASIISDHLNIITVLNKQNTIIKEKNKNIGIERKLIITVINDFENKNKVLIKEIYKNQININKMIKSNIPDIIKPEPILLSFKNYNVINKSNQSIIELIDIFILIIDNKQFLSNRLLNWLILVEKKNIKLIIIINKLNSENINNKLKNELIDFKTEYNLKFILINFINNKNFIFNLNSEIKNVIKKEKYIVDINDDFEGIVIDNNINKKSLITTTLYINSGNIKINDILVSEKEFVKIKTINNYKNQNLNESENNILIKITGFKNPPEINSVLTIINNDNIIKKLQKFRKYKDSILNSYDINLNQKEILNKCETPDDTPSLNLIIKSKTNELMENLKNSINNLKTKTFNIKIIKLCIGNVILSDIKLTKDTKSHLIMFGLKLKENIKILKKNHNLKLICTDDIKEIINYIMNLDSKSIFYESDNILGIAIVNKIFNIANKIILGCSVISGKAKIQSQIKIFRNESEIYKGCVESLKYLKTDVLEVKKGLECGIFVKNFKNFLINDIIKFYKI